MIEDIIPALKIMGSVFVIVMGSEIAYTGFVIEPKFRFVFTSIGFTLCIIGAFTLGAIFSGVI